MGKISVWHCTGCDKFFRIETEYTAHLPACAKHLLKRDIALMISREIIVGNMPPGIDMENWKRIKRKVQKSAFDVEDIKWNESESLDDVKEVTLLVKEWVYITYKRKPRPWEKDK